MELKPSEYNVIHDHGCWGCFHDSETGELYHCQCCEEQWITPRRQND